MNIPPLLPQRSLAIVLCNGPSLRGFDFATRLKGCVTFGMNLAYRHWDTIGWYPTYYSCLDRVVGLAHKEDIGRLVLQAAQTGIQHFLLRRNVVEALGLEASPLVSNFDALVEGDASFFRGYWASTGSLTTAWATMLGYRRLVLLGADADYRQYVDGAVHMSELVLKLERQPTHNPNYFFDDYQRKGDVYHIPLREHPEFPHEDQLLGWHMIRPQLQRVQALVVNANPKSKITAFPRCSMEETPRAFNAARRRQQRERKTHLLSPAYSRTDRRVLHTSALMAELFGKYAGVAVDVGACRGAGALPFLQRGWRVYALEADREHQQALAQLQCEFPLLQMEPVTLSCITGRTYPWCRHNTCHALHAMRGYTSEYSVVGEVTTSTLRQWSRARGVAHIDVLLCDVVGFELMVLRGLDFDQLSPDCIVCAWDDTKSLHLGSDMHDTGSFLLAQGYVVYMSQWHPQVAPSSPHLWHQLSRYPAESAHAASWGHFLAFRGKFCTTRLHQRLRQALPRHVSVSKCAPATLPSLPPQGRSPYVIRY